MILAAGKGERMGPLTREIPKALLNIAGKTLLELAVDRYRQSGIKDIVVAVGWKNEMIEDYASEVGLDVSLVHVPEYETGPLQTLLTAIETFDGEFLLSPVDAIIEPASVIGIWTHHQDMGRVESMTLAVSSNTTSGTPVEFRSDGTLIGFGNSGTASNESARSAMMLISHTRIRELCKSSLDNGKIRVVQLLEQLVKNGNSVFCFDVLQPWFDIDTLPDLLTANQHILHRGNIGGPGTVFIPAGDSVEVGNRLDLKTNIILSKGTYLQGPVLIASNCVIGEDSRIGPNVTLDSHTTVSKGCEVTDAVIFGHSTITKRSRLQRSIVYQSATYDAEV